MAAASAVILAGSAGRVARRVSGAAIGIVGAVGALGGLFIDLTFRQSFLVAGPATRRSGRSSLSTWSAPP
jgi:MFS transporter, NNP family, nitrate/nitrite transporter